MRDPNVATFPPYNANSIGGIPIQILNKILAFEMERNKRCLSHFISQLETIEHDGRSQYIVTFSTLIASLSGQAYQAKYEVLNNEVQFINIVTQMRS